MPAPEDLCESVVRQLMEGRNLEEGFRWLFYRYHSAVAGFFARKGFSPEDCRDLTQEVFVAVHLGIRHLRSEKAFVTWLFAIARHMALRHLDRRRRNAAEPVAASAAAGADGDFDAAAGLTADADADPLNRLLDAERAEILRGSLEELPGRVQACLRARLVEGLGYREIGERLGISENTVAVHVHRGMKSLRVRLKLFFGRSPFAREM